MAGWNVWLDMGRWGIYEVTNGTGFYETEDDAIDKVRRLQRADLASAKDSLELAKIRIQDAKRNLRLPVKGSLEDKKYLRGEK